MEVSGDRMVVGRRWLAEPGVNVPRPDLTVGTIEDPPFHREAIARPKAHAVY